MLRGARDTGYPSCAPGPAQTGHMRLPSRKGLSVREKGSVQRRRGTPSLAPCAAARQGPGPVVNNSLGRRGSGPAGIQRCSGGRLDGAGATRAGGAPQPASPPPHSTRPTIRREEPKKSLGSRPPASRLSAARQQVSASLRLTCRGLGVSLLLLPRGFARAGTAAAAGAARGGRRHFSLGSSEAASPVALRIVLPAQLGWAAASAAAPHCRERGGIAQPGDARPTQGAAMSLYGMA